MSPTVHADSQVSNGALVPVGQNNNDDENHDPLKKTVQNLDCAQLFGLVANVMNGGHTETLVKQIAIVNTERIAVNALHHEGWSSDVFKRAGTGIWKNSEIDDPRGRKSGPLTFQQLVKYDMMNEEDRAAYLEKHSKKEKPPKPPKAPRKKREPFIGPRKRSHKKRDPSDPPRKRGRPRKNQVTFTDGEEPVKRRRQSKASKLLAIESGNESETSRRRGRPPGVASGKGRQSSRAKTSNHRYTDLFSETNRALATIMGDLSDREANNRQTTADEGSDSDYDPMPDMTQGPYDSDDDSQLADQANAQYGGYVPNYWPNHGVHNNSHHQQGSTHHNNFESSFSHYYNSTLASHGKGGKQMRSSSPKKTAATSRGGGARRGRRPKGYQHYDGDSAELNLTLTADGYLAMHDGNQRHDSDAGRELVYHKTAKANNSHTKSFERDYTYVGYNNKTQITVESILAYRDQLILKKGQIKMPEKYVKEVEEKNAKAKQELVDRYGQALANALMLDLTSRECTNIITYLKPKRIQMKAHTGEHRGLHYKCTLPDCKVPNTIFPSPLLKVHLIKDHWGGIMLNQCPVCLKSYKVAKSLMQHMQLHVPPHLTPTVCRYYCKIDPQTCGFGSNDYHSTVQHVKKKHQTQGTIPSPYPGCDLTFISLHEAAGHRFDHDRHGPDNPVQCSWCDAKFNCNAMKVKHSKECKRAHNIPKKYVPKPKQLDENGNPVKRERKRKAGAPKPKRIRQPTLDADGNRVRREYRKGGFKKDKDGNLVPKRKWTKRPRDENGKLIPLPRYDADGNPLPAIRKGPYKRTQKPKIPKSAEQLIAQLVEKAKKKKLKAQRRSMIGKRSKKWSTYYRKKFRPGRATHIPDKKVTTKELKSRIIASKTKPSPAKKHQIRAKPKQEVKKQEKVTIKKEVFSSTEVESESSDSETELDSSQSESESESSASESDSGSDTESSSESGSGSSSN